MQAGAYAHGKVAFAHGADPADYILIPGARNTSGTIKLATGQSFVADDTVAPTPRGGALVAFDANNLISGQTFGLYVDLSTGALHVLHTFDSGSAPSIVFFWVFATGRRDNGG
jgi:hypothetical protein